MNLHNLLLTASLSGLTSFLAHAVFWSAVHTIRRPAFDRWDPALRMSEAVLHMLCGIGLGLLFWASWGLAALVDVSWWVRGVSFASLCWLTLALPSALSLALARSQCRAITAILASRWATTCLITGLACAWHWDHGVM